MTLTQKLIHALIIGVLIGAIQFVLQHSAFYTEASKAARLGIFVVVAFVVLLIANLLWPF